MSASAEVPDGGVRDGEPASSGAGDVGRIEEDAVGCEEALFEEPALVEELDGAQGVARPHPLDLAPTLREMGVDAPFRTIGEVADLPEERRAAGVGGMGREVAANPPARVAGVRGGELHRLVEGRAPDCGVVPALPSPGNRAHVDVEDAPADDAAEPDLDHRLRERLRMEVVVDHRRRARPEELVSPEPRESEHLLEGERRSLGDPRRVGRGMSPGLPPSRA